MSEKNVKVFNDENGYMIIRIAGREYITEEPVPMIDGKFRASDIQKAVFGTMV
jgi:hypothetical protein